VTLWPAQRQDREAFFDLQQQLRAVAGDDVVLHGGPTLTAALEEMLVRDLQRACWIAALLAVGMVTWWLRSLRHGLLALVPSVLGLVVTLVLLRLFDVPLSMISFVSVPFVLGIGVDEGVHLVGHYRHGATDTGATGVGIVRTSVGTVLGFSSLLLAATPGLQLLGGVVAFGSMACMLSCLFVLAPLLARTRRAG
jgi:predicted RND superfamily exporter protein